MERGATEFKRGSDLRTSARAGAPASLVCENCGEEMERNAARDLGWQVRPPVCPNCLRWSVTDTDGGRGDPISIQRRGRFWSVYENGDLLCVTVYRKGAAAVAARLTRDRRGNGHGSA